MITSKNRIDRRTVLRGAGGIALGLPFLSAMLRPGRSHAAEETPVRFIVVYTPGGTLLDKWLPTGGNGALELSGMMSPLAPYKNKLNFVNGADLSVTSIGVGQPHSRGMSAVLTGRELLPGTLNTNGGNASFANGISVDQVIAEKISKELRFKSLEVSAGWGTGIALGGQPHPANEINYAGSKQPIPPATDPLKAFQRVFGDTGTDGRAAVDWDKSILDAVASDYTRLSADLGTEDKAKLDAHLNEIRELERRLDATVSIGCKPPTNINVTPGYYEDGAQVGGSRGNADGGPDGVRTGVKVPEKGLVMTDILTAAMACDLTRVGTMQWADSEAKFMLSFLKRGNGEALADHHHSYQHDKGFQPDALEIIYNFYAKNVAYLLGKLDSVVEGNGLTMLDNSVVFHVSEIQKPDTHDQQHMPFMLAGGAGGKLAGGRVHTLAKQVPHNNLLVSLQNLFDIPVTTFGHPDFCSGAYPGLI